MENVSPPRCTAGNVACNTCFHCSMAVSDRRSCSDSSDHDNHLEEGSPVEDGATASGLSASQESSVPAALVEYAAPVCTVQVGEERALA